MKIRQIKYFLAVAKWGGFTHAAERIGVAQPALSAQIAKLEAQLGCPLFVRKARGVELTPAGLRFRGHVSEIIDKLELAYSDTCLMANQSGPEVMVGIPTLTSPLLVAPLVEAARKHLPLVTVRIHEGMGASLRDMLVDGQIDLAILYKVPGENFADTTLLFEEHFYIGAVSSIAHWEGDTIPAKWLSEIPLVLSTAGNSHRRQLQQFVHEAGSRLNIVAEVDSINGQMELVFKGVGATVLPLSGFMNWTHRDLRLARIASNGLVSQAYSVRSHKSKNTRTLTPVEDLMRKVIRELIEAGDWPGALPAHDPPPLNRSDLKYVF